jgi:O-antigen/teichoic acid export membrane protein
MATVFLLSVGLGVEGWGTWAALAGVAAIAAQLANAGTQEVACRVLLAGRVSLAALARARAALTLVVLGGAAAGALASVLGMARPGALLLAILTVDAVVVGWVEFLGTVLRARGRRLEEAMLLLLVRAAALAAVALALSGHVDLTTIALAHAASGVLPLALAVHLVRAAPGEPHPDASPRAIDALRESWPLALNSGLALASLRLEVLALLAWRGPAEAGLFALALKIVEALNGIPGAIAGGALPALTREALAQGAPEARERTARTVALLAVPGAALLFLLAPRVAAAWSPAYAPAAPYLRILGLALVPMSMNAVLLHALIAAGRPGRVPALTALRVAVAAVLAVVLIPRVGAAGAAWGFLAAELVLLLGASRACAEARFAVPVYSVLATAGIAYARGQRKEVVGP